jgi:hypothetical protein
MELFDRRPPVWSPITDGDGWEAFSALVREEAQRRQWGVDFEEGFATDGARQFGLGNVAGKCKLAERADWAAVVGQHFAAVAAIDGEPPRFAQPGDARAAMKARLVPDGFAGEDTDWVERRVAEDLRVVVAFDLPDTVTLPDREDALAYGEPEELLALALRQAREEPGLELTRHEIPGPEGAAPLYVLQGESFFTATHALWADALFDAPAAHGALVAVPIRHMVLATPVNGVRSVGMVAPMIRLVRRYYADGPGALSENLYWLHAGRLELQQAWADDDGPKFAPGPRFTELLNRLAGD